MLYKFEYSIRRPQDWPSILSSEYAYRCALEWFTTLPRHISSYHENAKKIVKEIRAQLPCSISFNGVENCSAIRMESIFISKEQKGRRHGLIRFDLRVSIYPQRKKIYHTIPEAFNTITGIIPKNHTEVYNQTRIHGIVPLCSKIPVHFMDDDKRSEFDRSTACKRVGIAYEYKDKLDQLLKK
jgi:hypothetical protein